MGSRTGTGATKCPVTVAPGRKNPGRLEGSDDVPFRFHVNL